MIDEAANITIESCINTVYISHLQKESQLDIFGVQLVGGLKTPNKIALENKIGHFQQLL